MKIHVKQQQQQNFQVFYKECLEQQILGGGVLSLSAPPSIPSDYVGTAVISVAKVLATFL